MESFFFTFGGGNFRVYFFISLMMMPSFALNQLKKCTVTLTIRAQLAFIAVMFLSTMFSVNFKAALFNTFSCVLYLLTSWAVGGMLVSGKIHILDYQKLLFRIAFGIIAFGLIQYVLFRVTGIALVYQDNTQLVMGQIPGVSVEANGHGKLVGFAAAFAIPMFVQSKDAEIRKKGLWLLEMCMITFFVSMTRNAFYAVMAVIFFSMFYYISNKKKRKRIANLLLPILAAALILYYLMVNGYMGIGAYSLIKLQRLFALKYTDLLADGSGYTRVKILQGSLEAWMRNGKTFLIGSGPAQAYIVENGNQFRVAAVGIIATLPSIGIIGEIPYVLMLISPLYESMRAIRLMKKDRECYDKQILLAEQTILLTVYLFAMDFVSPTYVYAEMWVVSALGIYWGMFNHRNTVSGSSRPHRNIKIDKGWTYDKTGVE